MSNSPNAALAGFAKLTRREHQVFQLVALGHSHRQIAAQLGLAPETVDVHVLAVMQKLDIHDRVLLARFAIRTAVASPTDTPDSQKARAGDASRSAPKEPTN